MKGISHRRKLGSYLNYEESYHFGAVSVYCTYLNKVKTLLAFNEKGVAYLMPAVILLTW